MNLLYVLSKLVYLLLYLLIYLVHLNNVLFIPDIQRRSKYKQQAWDQFCYQIAISFGSVFRKALQFTCTRTELFPDTESIVRRVCNQVEVAPLSEMKRLVDSAYPVSSNPFETFNWTPVGSGIIAQVHEATLSFRFFQEWHSKQPRTFINRQDKHARYKQDQLKEWLTQQRPIRVAVKIQRPFIKEQIEHDFDFLEWLVFAAVHLIRYRDLFYLIIRRLFTHNNNDNNEPKVDWTKEVQLLDKQRFELNHLINARLKQWKRDFLLQMDFQREMNNITEFERSYHEHLGNKIQVPHAFHALSRPKQGIIVMEWLQGTSISQITHQPTLHSMYNSLLEVAIHMLLLKPIYHSDLHAGNIMLIDSTNKLGIIDFGIVHEKSPDLIQKLQYVFTELMHYQWIQASVGIFDLLISDPDRERIALGALSTKCLFETAIQLYHIVTLHGYDHQISTGQVLQECFRILSGQKIKSHPELDSLDIACLTLEGTLQALRPHASLGESIFDNIVSTSAIDSTSTTGNNNNKSRKSHDYEWCKKQVDQWTTVDQNKGSEGILYKLRHYKTSGKKMITWEMHADRPPHPPQPWDNQLLIDMYRAVQEFQQDIQTHYTPNNNNSPDGDGL